MHRECTGGLKSLLSVHFLMTRWDQVYLGKGGSLCLAAEDQPEYLVLKQGKQILCSAQTACGFLLTEGSGRVSPSSCAATQMLRGLHINSTVQASAHPNPKTRCLLLFFMVSVSVSMDVSSGCTAMLSVIGGSCAMSGTATTPVTNRKCSPKR